MTGDGMILTAIVSFIVLIIFFVMAANIGKIKRDISDIKRVIIAFGKANDYGSIYKCENCFKLYEGKLAKCPHCGVEKVYDK